MGLSKYFTQRTWRKCWSREFSLFTVNRFRKATILMFSSGQGMTPIWDGRGKWDKIRCSTKMLVILSSGWKLPFWLSAFCRNWFSAPRSRLSPRERANNSSSQPQPSPQHIQPFHCAGPSPLPLLSSRNVPADVGKEIWTSKYCVILLKVKALQFWFSAWSMPPL